MYKSISLVNVHGAISMKPNKCVGLCCRLTQLQKVYKVSSETELITQCHCVSAAWR